jgi:hypothetical protein
MCALLVLAACGDRVTAPEDPVPPPVVNSGPELQLGNAAVTATRTVETYTVESGHRTLRSRLQRTFVLGDDAGVDRRDVLGDADASAVDRLLKLPVGGLVAPAERRPLDLAGRWRTRGKVSGFPGVEVEQEGIGDAPASELRYSRDGRPALRVVQEWRRAGSSWELVRRETTSPDGSYRDVVDVARPTLGSWARGGSTRPIRLGLAAYSEEDECAPCAAERKAANEALQTFLFADAAGLLICAFTPLPADVLACTLAALKATELYVKFLAAVKARDDCLARSQTASLVGAVASFRDTISRSRRSEIERVIGGSGAVCEEESSDPTSGGSGSDGSLGGYWISICETTYYGYCDTWTGECYITGSETNCWQEWRNAAVVASSDERQGTDRLLIVATGRTRDEAPVRLVRRHSPEPLDFALVDTTRASANDLGAIVAVFQAQRGAGVAVPPSGSHSIAGAFSPSDGWERGARRQFDGLLQALKRAPASDTPGIGTVRSLELAVPRVQVQRR